MRKEGVGDKELGLGATKKNQGWRSLQSFLTPTEGTEHGFVGFYKLCTDLSVTEVSLKIQGGVLPTEASLRHSRVLCMNG